MLASSEKAALWSRLETDARTIAEQFGLQYRRIEPEREGVRRHYGITYSDGTIRIRLRHASTGRPLKYSSLINTVCHELAHLRHFNHGERFKMYYFRILEWARASARKPGRNSIGSCRAPIRLCAPIGTCSPTVNRTPW